MSERVCECMESEGVAETRSARAAERATHLLSTRVLFRLRQCEGNSTFALWIYDIGFEQYR